MYFVTVKTNKKYNYLCNIKLIYIIFVRKYQHIDNFNAITMGNTNMNWIEMSDSAIVNKIGIFVKNERLNRNKTQAQLAYEAGINRWTISQIENGEAITLASLIQILRALGSLQLLDIFSIKNEISPIELAKQDQQKRKRARNSDTDHTKQSDW
jgi:transcriptional regulator with XRE-family HTH domain